ncbi:MAG TPA: hypothetical protein VKE97_04145 [Acidimicrobiia bacterium]|nr:hypothetical protein [Acidimicrobiia bacterium]
MGRKRVRDQITAATKPSLGSNEFITACSEVWATECGGRVPLLLKSRSRHYVALTDQRLILFRAPPRRRSLSMEDLLMAKRHSSFTLEKLRRYLPLLQVRVRDATDREIALEFRPLDRRVGFELAAALGGRARRRSDSLDW